METLDFTLLIFILEQLMGLDILGIIVYTIYRFKKYKCIRPDELTGQLRLTFEDCPKNNITKRMGLLFVFCMFAYIIATAFDEMPVQNANPFVIGSIVTALILGTILFMVPFFIVGGIIRAHRASKEKLASKALEVRKLEEENKDKELRLMKAKYRPIKCKYCDTMNSPKRTNCKNCGAVLELIDNRFLNEEKQE